MPELARAKHSSDNFEWASGLASVVVSSGSASRIVCPMRRPEALSDLVIFAADRKRPKNRNKQCRFRNIYITMVPLMVQNRWQCS